MPLNVLEQFHIQNVIFSVSPDTCDRSKYKYETNDKENTFISGVSRRIVAEKTFQIVILRLYKVLKSTDFDKNGCLTSLSHKGRGSIEKSGYRQGFYILHLKVSFHLDQNIKA